VAVFPLSLYPGLCHHTTEASRLTDDRYKERQKLAETAKDIGPPCYTVINAPNPDWASPPLLHARPKASAVNGVPIQRMSIPAPLGLCDSWQHFQVSIACLFL